MRSNYLTRGILAALTAGALTLTIAACGGEGGGGGGFASTSGIPVPSPTPPPQACSGQGLIGIDPVNNVGYVPISKTDGSGNAEVAVVDLTVGAKTPILSTIAITGSTRSIAMAYDPIHKTMLDETSLASGNDTGVAIINTTTKSYTGTTVTATGLGPTGFFGGIVENPTRKEAIVASPGSIGVLDTSVNPPTWNASSVVVTVGSDSLAVNLNTGLLFISDDGRNQIVDTTKSPLAPMSFDSSFNTTDGVAFDVSTNILILSQEVGADDAWAFNFATLDTTKAPAVANVIQVPGLGEAGAIGEGPGGMTVINCNTHQAVVADERGGENFKLLQLPTKPVAPGVPLDNNGQPGTGTTADAASVFTIAAAQIPTGAGGAILGMGGDPNSASIDPGHNLFYASAADINGNEYLVQVDLSKPVLGASPTGGVDGKTFWTPTGTAIPLP